MSSSSRTARAAELPQLELTFWEKPTKHERELLSDGSTSTQSIKDDEDDELPRVYVSGICTGSSQKECVHLLQRLEFLMSVIIKEVSSEAYMRLRKLYSRMRKAT